MSEKAPSGAGPSTAQEWADLELVCRFSDKFQECYVPFNCTEPTTNGIKVFTLQEWALKSSYYLTNELLQRSRSGNPIDPVDGYDGPCGHTPGNSPLRTGWKAKLVALVVSVELSLWERVQYLIQKQLDTKDFYMSPTLYEYC